MYVHLTKCICVLVLLSAFDFFALKSGAQTYSITDLGTLGGTSSAALAINGSSQIAGWSATSKSPAIAFLYSGGKMTSLGTLGGEYSEGYGINKSGNTVGYSAPVIQTHRLANSRRYGVSSGATVRAKPKKRVECLFSRTSSATTANYGHRRESPVPRIGVTISAQPIQNSGPKVIRLSETSRPVCEHDRQPGTVAPSDCLPIRARLGW